MTTANKKEAAIKKILADEKLSKSQKMIDIYLLGTEIKEIANIMEVRYNFVYNVVSNYCNMNKLTINTSKKEGKKEKIIALHLEGKSLKEISIEIQSPYNYVFNTVKDFKKKLEGTTNTEAAAE